MTETEWLECSDPTRILNFLRMMTNTRRLQLFVAACCVRSTKGYSIPEWDTELKALVSLGHGEIETDEFERRLKSRWESVEAWALWRAETARRNVALEVVLDDAGQLDWPRIRSRGPDEAQAQCRLLQDIFGNPFRPVHVDPIWLTSTVVSLATSIYDERAFDRLPVLADALEDAGCDNVDILNHCRQPGDHVRGCWPVDLLLGKS